jgi:hypothetical protein
MGVMHHVQAFTCLTLLVIACQYSAEATNNAQHQQRSLLQAISNSDGCLTKIPKCERGACINRSVNYIVKMVCARCTGNFEPVVDGDSNILQCGECTAVVQCCAGGACTSLLGWPLLFQNPPNSCRILLPFVANASCVLGCTIAPAWMVNTHHESLWQRGSRDQCHVF